MRLVILQDGVYNDQFNRAKARKAGDLHDTTPMYGAELIKSGLARGEEVITSWSEHDVVQQPGKGKRSKRR